jgi:hypothetical protein
MNKETNPAATCLFEGAKLEMKMTSAYVLEFGFCFPRASFIYEREHLNLSLQHAEARDGWVRRKPSDSDRLRVNRDGWEILYCVQPPASSSDVTVSEVISELCRTLRIADRRRVALASGPFYWGKDFKENGLGIYGTYFNVDMVVDGRHMRTVRGSALIDVLECSVIDQL